MLHSSVPDSSATFVHFYVSSPKFVLSFSFLFCACYGFRRINITSHFPHIWLRNLDGQCYQGMIFDLPGVLNIFTLAVV